MQIKAGKTSSEPSSLSALDTEEFMSLRTTIRQVFPQTLVVPYLTVGATDSRHYAGLTDNIYRFVPGRITTSTELDRLHGVDERIAIENYARSVLFYVRFIRNFDY